MFYRLILLALFVFSNVGTAGALVNDNVLQGLQENINGCVAQIRPSVVSIRAQKQYKDAAKQAGALWFESIGAGFIVDARGYIVTNYHVVGDAVNINVKLWHNAPNTYVAKMVLADKELDLALIQINADAPLSPVLLGDNERVEVGDLILSVGSPFGFDHSVSMGLVSSIGRDLLIGGNLYKEMIQTDAVINEGNSGGPVVDMLGQVVGVNTAIYAPDGTYTGLGFIIPINRVKNFFSRITGLVTAAAIVPNVAQQNKLAIDINKKMPGDKIHAIFSDCTACHIITTKMVVSTQVQMTHIMVGSCNNCHIMENAPPPTGQPIQVAAISPFVSAEKIGTNEWKFSTRNLLKIIPLTLVAAIVFAMLGVGGGFLYVPILLVCGVDFYTAAATSLLMLTAAAASALPIFSRSGLMDFKLVMFLEIPMMVAAFTGGLIAERLDIIALYILFSVFLFIASYFMLKDEKSLAAKVTHLNLSPFQYCGNKGGTSYEIDLAIAIPLTALVGLFGGILGIAGGWFVVPMLVVLFAVPMRVAVASSSLMVPFTGIAGFMGHSSAGHFDPDLAIALALVTMVGAQIGARMSIKANTNLLKVIFALILSLVGIAMLGKMMLILPS